VCGAYSLTREGQSSALLAVCDVLVLKALDRVGSWIVRRPRDRYQTMGGKPLYLAHTVWPAHDEVTARALLNGAWDVVPALMDGHGWESVTSGQITTMLDDYVHDLVLTGKPHNMADLAYRFTSRLGMPVYLNPPLIPPPTDNDWLQTESIRGPRR
jgi:hypothetical protein